MNRSAWIDSFYQLSIILTGFEQTKLYATGMGDTYLNTLIDILGEETTGELLEAYYNLTLQERQGGAPVRESIDTLLQDAKWGPLCRNIIRMWYMGNWYQMPAGWRQTYVSSELDVTKVLGSQAYIEGLVWRAMGRHPKSARQPGYGTWAFEPENN